MRQLKLLFLLIFLFSTSVFASPSFPELQNPNQLLDLFPKSVEEMVQFREETIAQLDEARQQLKEASAKENNFETTLLGFDQLSGYLTVRFCNAEVLTLVAVDPALRKEAQNTVAVLINYISDLYATEELLYKRIQSCYDQNAKSWTPDQIYLTEQILHDFKLAGAGLSQKDRAQFLTIQKEITKLEQAFQENLQKDDSHFYASQQELQGLSDKVLKSLSQNEEGLYRIGCDYPTFGAVMTTCSKEETRKKMKEYFSNRGYPENREVLTNLIEKRDRLASLLGYPSYAHLSLSNKMAKDPAVAHRFLEHLFEASQDKENLEFKELTQNLPEGVTLTKEGKLKSWDYGYVKDQYKKKHYQLDSEKIAEYFPLESTFQGLIRIYEQFFNLKIEQLPVEGLWHEDVTVLAIRESDQSLIGYVILDLFPREGKYTHACNVSGVALRMEKNGECLPGLDVVVANFTKPTPETPSLLKHSEVTTLFHEFGHALHDLFSKHSYLSFTGMGSFMKRDFVELPSQMLEEWIWDPSILKQVSLHYQTKEPLTEAQIEKLVGSKNMDSGYFLRRQCSLSFLSLQLFSEGRTKDVDQIQTEIFDRSSTNIQDIENNHMYASFGHLIGYDAAYYGYMFSKVYASDLFAQISKEGLLNPQVGTRYRKTVLEKGCSKDPNQLLIDFLGRSPNQDAFTTSLGLVHD